MAHRKRRRRLKRNRLGQFVRRARRAATRRRKRSVVSRRRRRRAPARALFLGGTGRTAPSLSYALARGRSLAALAKPKRRRKRRIKLRRYAIRGRTGPEMPGLSLRIARARSMHLAALAAAPKRRRKRRARLGRNRLGQYVRRSRKRRVRAGVHRTRQIRRTRRPGSALKNYVTLVAWYNKRGKKLPRGAHPARYRLMSGRSTLVAQSGSLASVGADKRRASRWGIRKTKIWDRLKKRYVRPKRRKKKRGLLG